MKRLCLLFAVAAGLAANPAGAAHLVVSDFTGIGPGVNTPWTLTSELDPHLDFYGWVRGAGAIGSANVTNAFGFYVSATATQSTLAEAISQNEYIACSLSPQPGYTLDLNGVQMTFGIQRLSYHAPRRYAVFTSVGGFAKGQQLYTSAAFTSGNYNDTELSFFSRRLAMTT